LLDHALTPEAVGEYALGHLREERSRMNHENPYFTRDQTEAFAAGLVAIAEIDGRTPQESQFIEEFLKDAGYPELIEGVWDRPFVIEDAVLLFPTSFARSLFIRGCAKMILADHQVTPEEREALEFMRRAFVPSTTVDELIAEAGRD
jgi:hypothetical protein